MYDNPDSRMNPGLDQAMPASAQAQNGAEDLTGRDRLTWNVLFSWAGHLVFIVAGFIMPRMIDRRLGQELLGVWDFSWSLVHYFGLVQAGVGSSVNRYVAKCRAAGDVVGMNGAVSSAFCIMSTSSLVVLGLSVAASLLLPTMFGHRLQGHVRDAQLVVFLLGGSLAINMAFGAFHGVLTGCHRWGLHNIIKSACYAVTIVGMICTLLLKGDLRMLALINLFGTILSEAVHVLFAYRVCEGLWLRPSLVTRGTIRKLFVFGGKTLIPSVSNLLLNQTTSILIVLYLGPASLALFTRPRSLMHHVNTLVNKMAFVLTPITGAMQGANHVKQIQGLVTTSVRYSLYLVLPIVLVLIVFGGTLMQLWMGPRYANGVIPAILAIGSLASLAHVPILNILVGLNAHGRAGMAQFVASLCSATMVMLALGYFDWGLMATAVAITLPLAIVNMLYLPILICRRTELSLRQYFAQVAVKPIVFVLPFAISLIIANRVFSAEPLMGLLWGSAIGGAVLAVLYGRYVLPDGLKAQIRRLISMGPIAAFGHNQKDARIRGRSC
jgi:O-antigen/teichoic acid export membrane protein